MTCWKSFLFSAKLACNEKWINAKNLNDNQSRLVNYNEDLQILFIHNPKCGGTSIGRALGIKNLAHLTIEQTILILNPQKFYGALKISLIRNPIDRLQTLYQYACSIYNVHLDNWKKISKRILKYPNLYTNRIKQ